VLILASASPRRRELLERISPRFVVRPSDVEERLAGGPLTDAVAALALEKARSVARDAVGSTVLGADTIVVVEGEVLGKPRDADDATRMLRRLRGQEHVVITGVAVVDGDASASAAVVSRVFMARYGDDEIERYVRSGEPMDKAGAYAIQGLGGALIVGVIGSYTNVIGLPLGATRRLLEAFAVPLRGPESIGDATLA
jgi:nucleoside triphosphate pyrophosphatase